VTTMLAAFLSASMLTQLAATSIAQASGPPAMSLLGSGNPASNYAPPSSGDLVNDVTGNFSETYTDALSLPREPRCN
jgi:hypothetical protein